MGVGEIGMGVGEIGMGFGEVGKGFGDWDELWGIGIGAVIGVHYLLAVAQ